MKFFGKKSLLAGLFGLAALACASGQKVAFRPIKVNTGDIQNTEVVSAAEDSTGMVWATSRNGLWRYDGSKIYKYELAKDAHGNPVSLTRMGQLVFSQKRPNWLWLASTFDGLFGLDITTGRTEHYRHDPARPNTPGGNQIVRLCEADDGVLWFSSDNYALNRFDGQEFRTYSPPRPPDAPQLTGEGELLSDVVVDAQNPHWVWVACRFGAYRFDARSETFEFFPFPVPAPFVYDGTPMVLFSAPDGVLWAGGTNTSLLRLDPQATRFVPVVPQRAEPFEQKGVSPAAGGAPVAVSSISLYDDGRLFIGYYPDGLMLYDPKRNFWEPVSPFGANTLVTVLLRHRKTSAWFVRATYELYRLTTAPRRFHFEPLSARNPTIVSRNWQRAYLMSPDQSHLLIGTLNGFGLLDWDVKSDSIRILPPDADLGIPIPDPALPEMDIMYDDLFRDPDGRTIWVGTTRGLMVTDGARSLRWYSKKGTGRQAEIMAHIDAIFADERRVWLGTLGQGVLILDKNTGEVRPLFQPGSDLFKKISKTRRLFCDSRRNIWIGCDDGLICVSPEENVLEKFFPANEHGEALASPKVVDIEETPDGNIWLATYGGLHRFNPAAPRGQRLTLFRNVANDLANFVNDIFISQSGDFWLATESHITMFKPATGTFVNFTGNDGLFIRHRLLMQFPDGHFISGANAGNIFFDPKDFQAGPAPEIYWRDFRVFDRPYAKSASLNTLAELSLQPGENHFSFEFGAINFEENATNTFAYQLVGYDHDWVYSSERTFASYTNLPPGGYHFVVKAANRFGIWSEPRSIAVQILPPFYRTWWFALLAFALFVALVWQAKRAWEMRQWSREAQRIIDYFANSTYTGSSVDEILWDVCRNCISRLNFEDTVIYMMDKERGVLVQKAAFGPKNPQDFEILNPIERRVGQGIVGAAAASGKPILLTDTRLDPRYEPDLEPMLSEIAVPIIHNGEVIGILDSEHSRRNFFTVQHLNILQSIANLISAKIIKAEAEEAMRRKEIELAELDRRLAESELTALKAQMNPHFLFNCLNSINWYIVKNRPLEASKYLTKFSRLIRLILDNSKHHKIALSTELETLRLYVEMESIRFEQKFEHEIAVSSNLEPDDVKIAPMILQPYVENAIWHGLMPLDGIRTGRLRVEISQRDGHLHCVIEDNGIGREAASAHRSGAVGSRESRGMRITAERIAMLNQGDGAGGDFVQIIDLQDENGQPAGTRVELRLPLEGG